MYRRKRRHHSPIHVSKKHSNHEGSNKRTLPQLLAGREISNRENQRMKRSCVAERFAHFTLQAIFDVVHGATKHDHYNPRQTYSSGLEIQEITTACGMVFGLTGSGLCVVFLKGNGKQLCMLNRNGEEVIRSCSYNRRNHSILTVSATKTDNYSSLHCRTIPIEAIQKGCVNIGEELFEDESLRYPGFVEFDDINGVILTYSAIDDTYKLWRLEDYSLLYKIRSPNIQEIRPSNDLLLVVNKFDKSQGTLTMKLLAIDSGQELKKMSYQLDLRHPVQFVEQSGHKILIKQEQRHLQIIDIITDEVEEIPETQDCNPAGFTFVYQTQIFITAHPNKGSCIWNYKGEPLYRYDDLVLPEPRIAYHSICAVPNQDLMIGYFKQSHDPSQPGVIKVVDSKTGKTWIDIGYNADKDSKSKGYALEEVTCLFYDEEANEIITGNRDGHICIWTN